MCIVIFRLHQIKQLLRLYEQGFKIKSIARELGISKNTVKSYITKVATAGWSPVELLKLDDPVLGSKFYAGNPAYKDDRYDTLKSQLSYYAGELKKTSVTKTLLWEEYRIAHPNGYGRSQFGYHLLKHIKTVSPSMVLQHLPGEELMVDFAGKPLFYIDRSTGEVINCQVFVGCLPFSDYGFAMAVRSQNISDFIHALSCVWKLWEERQK